MERLRVGAFVAFACLSVCALGDIALEAEYPSEIVAPMTVATAEDVGALGPKPLEPSRGGLVWAPGPPVTGGGGAGYVKYVVDIPEADAYAIWGHVIAWDGNSDSLWVTVPVVDGDENPQQTDNFEFRWNVQTGVDWHWDRVNQWLDAGTFEREWELDAGETEIVFWSREDATILDAIWITTDLAANVGRFPTDDEVERQINGLSVEARDKLALQWARLKTR